MAKFTINDTPPTFALPNSRVETVELEKTLEENRAVITFYRGYW